MKQSNTNRKPRRGSNPVEWFLQWVKYLDGIEQDNVIAAFLPERKVKTSSLREIAARPITDDPPDMVKRVMDDFEEIFEYTMKHGKKRPTKRTLRFDDLCAILRTESEPDRHFTIAVKILLHMYTLLNSLPKVEQWSEEFNAMKVRSHEILDEAKDIFSGEDFEFAKTLPEVLMKHHLSYYERFERLKDQWEPFHRDKFNLQKFVKWEDTRASKSRSTSTRRHKP